ncbi:MAG: GyrI-like domain-containing protein [Erysipelotrichaceae bacterium]|nr:GyrI-like domain-containing protein [Erysipelotrichaceae bacterium]MDY5251424.1 GyrI-like domain-containing protein [Erysipelotrichaceae bacterium]
MYIEEFKEIKIAYMRQTGKYGNENKKLMEIFKSYLKQNNLFNDDTIILGIALDDPNQTSEQSQRYDVGMVINTQNNLITLPTRNIDDGKYAIFEIDHTYEDISNFWQNIPVITNQLSIDHNKSIIERYAYRKIVMNKCEMCVPLK